MGLSENKETFFLGDLNADYLNRTKDKDVRPWPNDSIFHSTFTRQKIEEKIESFGHLVE